MRFSSLVAILFILLQSNLALSQVHHIVVIAHRGEHIHHPENTIPAYKAAIKLGADFIEVDVRTTSDGKLVVMHDGTVNRTTNGTGEVANLTWRQIRALDAGIKFSPRFRGTRVPTFDEVLRLARGKIGIYADVKQASARAIADALNRYGMVQHTVVYGYPFVRQDLVKLVKLYPQITAMPEAPNEIFLLQDLVKLDPQITVMPEAFNEIFLRKIIPLFHPRVIAFSAGNSDFKDPLITITKQAGAKIYVDRMGATDNPAGWGDAIRRGADGIQTNFPRQLVRYLRKQHLHDSR